MPGSDRLFVAVVGGGIVGLHLVIGLLARGVDVKVYEQARSFREIGAGIGFVPSAVRSMALLDERIVGIYDRIATRSGDDPSAPTNWFSVVNGYEPPTDNPSDMGLHTFFRVETPKKGFESVYRADFLDELVKLVPAGVCEFNKRLDTIEDRGDDEKVLLKFHDGTTAEADAVIGCDGIKSTVRRLILGADHPASTPSYTHWYAYRALVSMDRAIATVGPALARNRSMIGGPGAHVVCYPISAQKTMNLVAIVKDPAEWADPDVTTEQATREEAQAHFKNFAPAVRALVGCFPDKVGRWAMYDSGDNPAPTYVKGRVAIAGDAAHASVPHHGAGAAMGIEDVLMIASMMPHASDAIASNPASKADAVRALFKTYNRRRKERSQWVVASSRYVGDIVEWQNEEVGSDWARAEKEMNERSHKIWDYDVQKMADDAVDEFKRELGGLNT